MAEQAGSVTAHSYQTFFPLLQRQKRTVTSSPLETEMGCCRGWGENENEKVQGTQMKHEKQAWLFNGQRNGAFKFCWNLPSEGRGWGTRRTSQVSECLVLYLSQTAAEVSIYADF